MNFLCSLRTKKKSVENGDLGVTRGRVTVSLYKDVKKRILGEIKGDEDVEWRRKSCFSYLELYDKQSLWLVLLFCGLLAAISWLAQAAAHFVSPDREFRSALLLLMEVTGNRTRLGTIRAKAVGPGVKADRRPFVCSNKSAAAYFSLFVFNSLLWHHLSHSGMEIHVQSVDGSRWEKLSEKNQTKKKGAEGLNIQTFGF